MFLASLCNNDTVFAIIAFTIKVLNIKFIKQFEQIIEFNCFVISLTN